MYRRGATILALKTAKQSYLVPDVWAKAAIDRMAHETAIEGALRSSELRKSCGVEPARGNIIKVRRR